jgi:hypothetical protein
LKRPAALPDPTFLPASLAASNVGTWDYDVPRDCMRYCRATAALYGLPIAVGAEGVSIDRMTAVIHPEDKALGRTKRMHMLQHGGTFAYEYRVLPRPGVMRWVLVRGCFEPDETGRIVRGRGIVVDITECKQEGFAAGDVFFITEADDKSVSALDRATRYVLAARRALTELGPAGEDRLRPAADALLLEIAQHIAGTMVPVIPSRTEH